MNDPVLKISVCDRRNNTKYKNQERNWSWIKERNRRPIRTSETVAEYPDAFDKIVWVFLSEGPKAAYDKELGQR